MTILLCSSNRAVIKRWQGLLPEKTRFEIASTVPELWEKCAEKTFDLVIIHRLLVDAVAFTELRKQSPLSKCFLLSDQPKEEECLTYLKLGIVGYGNTYISPARLLEAVRVVMNGGVWLGQRVIQHLIQESNTRNKESKDNQAEKTLTSLTKAERKISELVSRGHSNLEIAADLNISERTVKAHLTSIYEKTKTGSRLSLALLVKSLQES